jgi:hypothetical protein
VTQLRQRWYQDWRTSQGEHAEGAVHAPAVTDVARPAQPSDRPRSIIRTVIVSLQWYAVEKTLLEARARGYAISELALDNGSIKVQIIEGS